MPAMRISIYFSAALLALIGFTGCRGRQHPDLYQPGDIEVWRLTRAADQQDRSVMLPRVEMVTTLGVIVIELFEDEAPVSTANFLEYVKDGFFDGTIFHRIVPGFVVQGGGFTADMVKKPTLPPIVNEAGNGLRNVRGSVAAARTMDMNSATSQFYVNLVDNSALNGDGVEIPAGPLTRASAPPPSLSATPSPRPELTACPMYLWSPLSFFPHAGSSRAGHSGSPPWPTNRSFFILNGMPTHSSIAAAGASWSALGIIY